MNYSCIITIQIMTSLKEIYVYKKKCDIRREAKRVDITLVSK